MGAVVSISNELADRISAILAELHQKTDATCVLLADTSGQLVARHGSLGADTAIFAALAASDMGATAELARILKESEPFKMHLHEGRQYNIYLCTVQGSFLLAVVFRTTVQIGLVRIFSTRAAEALVPLAKEFESEQVQSRKGIDADLSASLAAALEHGLRES